MTAHTSLPLEFSTRMRAWLGSEADAFLAALEQPSTTDLRVNTLKLPGSDLQHLVAWPLDPIPWCPSGFCVAPDMQPGKHPFHAAGLYYLQDAAAMAVAEALAPEPGERILDLAAAPGGKTTHITALSGDTGLVVANDIDVSRSRTLISNLERWGTRRTLVTAERPDRLATRWGNWFDRVLLDAPCSGESMFRKSASARSMWSIESVLGCALRQGHLLRQAAALVRPGGTLVYSTCTFAPEENEYIIAAFLAEYPDFDIQPLLLPRSSPGRPDWLPPELFNPNLERAARFWPHMSAGDGHFIARLQRNGDMPADQFATSLPLAATAACDRWNDFMRSTFKADLIAGSILTLHKNQLYAVPEELPPLDGIRIARAGLWLGTLQKDRFIPSHSLALALRPYAPGKQSQCQRDLNLEPDDQRLTRYLQGHPLNEPGDAGWIMIRVAGFPIGWGRRTGGIIKNMYPKGLRWPLH